MDKVAAGEQAAAEAKHLLDGLAKPVGSLGRLETLGIQLCRAQRQCPPTVDALRVVVFAADHGVATSEKVSPFPSSVTVAMVDTILSGGAAVSSLAHNAGAHLEVCNVGVAGQVTPPSSLQDNITYFEEIVAKGTQSLASQPAMSAQHCASAVEQGRLAARRSFASGAKVLAIGEIGIGSTTSSSALASKLLGLDPSTTVGPGTGLDPEGVKLKTQVVVKALARSACEGDAPLAVLADLGGLEIAAMVGCMMECYELGIAAIVDGFIASAAALVACKHNSLVKTNLIFATRSAEPGHVHMMKDMLGTDNCDTQPLLDWGLRLGEASGAALCLPLIRASGNLFDRVETLASVLEKLK